MAKRVTIYEVAKRAGVSISTVSQALNKPDRVSEGTRERILAAAAELGFVPAAEMAVLARKGGRIGVIAPLTAYASYMRRLGGVLDVFGPLETEVCVYDRESAAVASPLLSSLPLNRRLDGLIIMGLSVQSRIVERVIEQGLPTVVVDFATRDFSSIGTDDEHGGRLAGEHLLERGYRRIAYIRERGGDTGVVLGGHRRMDGFLKALASGGIGGDAVTTAEVEHSIAGARAGVRAILAADQPPAALMCHDDTIAVGALMAAHDCGLAVPGEVAVMGFDDGEAAAAAGLTTVRQPFEESGRAAARALIEHMRKADQPKQAVTLSVDLVVRDTT